jgi:CubicO group peptidase (beta-lactamase class C family)
MLKQLLLCSLALALLAASAAHAQRRHHHSLSRSYSSSSSTTGSARTVAVLEETAKPASSAAESSDEVEPAAPEPGPPPSLEDVPGLTAFFDGAMKVGMERHHVTGAVIALVKDGHLLLARGYGRGDIARGIPIDPATSLFRVGSITKTFTWTAVMQLVEDGKLDLDQDVNVYLTGVHVPMRYGKPVTLRSLMTHTAGFEDASIGFLLQLDPRRQLSIEEAMRKHMPERVMPPGDMPAYSNFGAALAGLIVEKVSGLPYNDYIEKRIFPRLGMQHATVQEPVPDKLTRTLTTAYRFESGMERPQPFEVVGGFRPAGSASVSALDMTHFMLAQLGEGRYEDRQILKPETVKQMHETAVTTDLRFPGMTLGFYKLDINGNEAIAHGGDTIRYHSDMLLLPKQRFGLFLSFITNDGAVREEVEDAFFSRYFPERISGPPRLDDTIALLLAAKYSGWYQWTRRNHSDLEKVLNLFRGIKVTSLGNGNLLVSGLGHDPLQFEPVASDLYREVLHGNLKIAFRSDAAGLPTHMFVSTFPFMATERTPWYEQSTLWLAALGAAFLVLLGVLASTYYRWHDIRKMGATEQNAVAAAAFVAGWALATALVLGGALVSTGVDNLVVHIPLSLTLGLAMPLIFVGLTIWLLVMTVLAWRGGFWTVGRRIGYSVTPLAALVLCLFFFEWNLLGWFYG